MIIRVGLPLAMKSPSGLIEIGGAGLSYLRDTVVPDYTVCYGAPHHAAEQVLI